MNEKSVGEKIKQLRLQTGFSQTLIAEYLKVDQSLVSKIEKGERAASTDVLKKLAELFGCRVNVLLEGGENVQRLNVAFRTNGMSAEDLRSIAVINRIALNLENMNRMQEGWENAKHK